MLRKNFDYNLQVLRNDVLRMGSIVEKQIHESIEALTDQNEELAQKIIRNDDLIDKLQKEIEYKCIKLIAKEQPLAEDLRFIFTTIKIVTDLERMADHAVDICKITILLRNEKYIKELVNIPKISEIVKNMIKRVLDAYVSKDVDKCYYVCEMDDDIDNLYRKTFTELINIMVENNSNVNQASQFLFICKYLERIGDHVTNICENIIYLVTGEKIDLNE